MQNDWYSELNTCWPQTCERIRVCYVVKTAFAERRIGRQRKYLQSPGRLEEKIRVESILYVVSRGREPELILVKR